MSADVSIIVGSKGGAGATTLCVDAATLHRAQSRHRDRRRRPRRPPARWRCCSTRCRALGRARERRTWRRSKTACMTLVGTGRRRCTAAHDPPGRRPSTRRRSLPARKALILVDAPQPFAAAVRPFMAMGRRFIMIVEPSVLGITSARVDASSSSAVRHRSGAPRHRNGSCATRATPSPQTAWSPRWGARVIVEVPVLGERRNTSCAIELFTRTRAATPYVSGSPLLPLGVVAGALGDRRLGPRRPDAKVIPFVAPGQHRAGLTAACRRASRKWPFRRPEDGRFTTSSDAASTRAGVGRATDESGKIAELRAQVDAIVGELLIGRADARSAEEVARLKHRDHRRGARARAARRLDARTATSPKSWSTAPKRSTSSATGVIERQPKALHRRPAAAH